MSWQQAGNPEPDQLAVGIALEGRKSLGVHMRDHEAAEDKEDVHAEITTADDAIAESGCDEPGVTVPEDGSVK